MQIIKSIVQLLAIVLCCLTALMSIPLFLRLHWPAPVSWILKLFASALSPLFASVGVLSIIVGVTTGSVFISSIGKKSYACSIARMDD
jgi:hypothetical protein